VVLGGIASYISIPKESSPDVKVPLIYLFVHYEGIAPEDAVNLLIKPLEKSFKTLQNVKKITATAIEGGASMMIEFIAGIDTDIALQDVRSSVDDAMDKLPDNTKRPKIMEIDLSLEPIISIVLNGDLPERTLLQIARDMKDKLEELPSVLEVDIGGDREESLEIVIKPEVMESYNLSIANLQGLISGNNRLIAAGTLEGETGGYAIKVPSVVNDFEGFLNFPVKVDGDSVVLLKDIAEVRSTFKDPITTARVNGKSALVLNVKKRTGSNIIKTIEAVKEAITHNLDNIPSQLNIFYTQDHANRIIDMVTDLENSIIIGVILVMMVMIITIGGRSAVLVALSIPASFFAGILMLDLCGFTLNVVVLFSLILTVGMIVDDAIVVSEYANRKMIDGVPSNQAFEMAATRMFWPIFTSTMVKIIVFLPLLFWPGVMGQFMKYMPITVIAILTSSLIFALFMQPSLGPLFGKIGHITVEEVKSMQAAEAGDLHDLHGISASYAALLDKILSKPKLFVVGLFFVLILVYAVFIFAGTGKEFFPSVEPDRATLIVGADGNLSRIQKEAIMQTCENKINYLKDEVAVFYTSSGSFSGSGLPDDTIGDIVIEFQDWKKRRKAAAILDDIRKSMDTIPGIKYQILQQRMGPPSRKPIAINIASSDPDKLDAFSEKFILYLKGVDGLLDIDNSFNKASMEWRIKVNRTLAAKYSLDVGTIGQHVQLVSDGMKITAYNPSDNDDQVDILLRFPKEYRTIMQIKNLKVLNAAGEAIPMYNFAEVVPAPKVGIITRINGSTTVIFSANIADGVLADTKVQEIKDWLKNNIDPSIKASFAGDQSDQDETSAFLGKAFLVALMLMFFIMLIQFNNFYHTMVVMSAVFLSTVGVLLGLLIFRQPFSIVMSGVGIIALGGIVLNNNIIFVDTYQHLLREGVEKHKAIVMAGVQRFRPIILTAVTAILGLLPMVLGLTIDFYTRSITYDAPSSQMWRPLATSIVGGLTFATILTLLFTPCLLLLEKDKKK